MSGECFQRESSLVVHPETRRVTDRHVVEYWSESLMGAQLRRISGRIVGLMRPLDLRRSRDKLKFVAHHLSGVSTTVSFVAAATAAELNGNTLGVTAFQSSS